VALPKVDPGFMFYRADINQPASLVGSFDHCDAVVHLAAKDLSTNASDEEYLTTNVIGTWNVCTAAAQAGVGKLIHISSTAVLGLYDSQASEPIYLPIDEQHPSFATRPYGVSKLLGEKVAAAFSRQELDIVCLRLPMVAFPSEIEGMAAAARDLNEPRLFCYVAPEDVAQAVLHALDFERGGWSVFNVSAADSYGTLPTLDMLARVHGKLPEVRNLKCFDDAPRASIIDIEAAKRDLGFVPKFCWSQLTNGIN
jgi:nucleoside-diphosphate-sugar epimerase